MKAPTMLRSSLLTPRSDADAMAVASACSSSDRATVGGLSLLPADLSLFVAKWIAAPARTFTPRPDYGPQYNGGGECPF